VAPLSFEVDGIPFALVLTIVAVAAAAETGSGGALNRAIIPGGEDGVELAADDGDIEPTSADDDDDVVLVLAIDDAAIGFSPTRDDGDAGVLLLLCRLCRVRAAGIEDVPGTAAAPLK
jgi:hypothetical protein